MTKQKKKRNKKYSGVDAAMTRPTITKLQAVHRSRLGQWWYDNKRRVKPLVITVVVVAVIIWLISELVRLLSNA